MSESAAERAYRAIRDGILDGTHEPGSMLGEESLAQAIGVSRTPVRTALSRLQQEGWITVYPKRGAQVVGLDDRAVADLAAARLLLETNGVRQASSTARTSLADRLFPLVTGQRDAFAHHDLREFVELTIAFHRGFVEVGGNSVLLELYDRLADRHRFLLFASSGRLLSHCSDVIREHERLVESLRSDDLDTFVDVLTGHMSELPPAPDDAFTRLALRQEHP
ncbi:GntR family transcriptional regulator [Aestuariimicrobium soli]|uniref:GntR family transcriptional regulator n=1 Tax=Aestuariimicrobium soli TaxID=2035834 RepID=UPI003EB9B422